MTLAPLIIKYITSFPVSDWILTDFCQWPKTNRSGIRSETGKKAVIRSRSPVQTAYRTATADRRSFSVTMYWQTYSSFFIHMTEAALVPGNCPTIPGTVSIILYVIQNERYTKDIFTIAETWETNNTGSPHTIYRICMHIHHSLCINIWYVKFIQQHIAPLMSNMTSFDFIVFFQN